MSLDQLKSNNSSSKAGKFFGKLLQSRDVAHLTHLRVTGEGSFASHSALQGYYDGVLPLIDQLIEVYQGCYGIITDIEIGISTSKTGSLQYFKELKQYILKERGFLSESFLLNISDEIIAELVQLIYKLENLK